MPTADEIRRRDDRKLIAMMATQIYCTKNVPNGPRPHDVADAVDRAREILDAVDSRSKPFNKEEYDRKFWQDHNDKYR